MSNRSTALRPLPAGVTARIRQSGQADLLVGIPSFNDERTIGHVVRVVAPALGTRFRDAKAILVLSDGGSTDRTREILEQTDAGNVVELHVEAGPPHPRPGFLPHGGGLPGKGWALGAIFQAAVESRATACAVIDGSLRSVTGQWVELLLEPVLRGDASFVAPVYALQKFDGMLARLLVSPLTQALYGKRVRQPFGGDYGFAGRLAERFLSYGSWDGPAARYGINLFATTTALAEGETVVEAFLGAKVPSQQDPSHDLAALMIGILSTAFDLAETFEAVWMPVRGSTSVPLFGSPYTLGVEPEPVRVDSLAASFRRAALELVPIWSTFLSRASMVAISEAAGHPLPRMADEVWVRILYETLAGWHRRVLPEATLIRALLPLYLGKVAALAAESRESTGEETEGRCSHLATVFEERKDLLRALWAVR